MVCCVEAYDMVIGVFKIIAKWDSKLHMGLGNKS